MIQSEKKKIALLLFHVSALLFMVISGMLLLGDITQSINPNEFIDTFSFCTSKIMSLIAVIIGATSWLIMVTNWIRDKQINNYLKLVLFLTTLIICGLPFII